MKMNYKTVSCLLFFYVFFLLCHSQARHEEFDTLIKNYINDGLYVKASNAIVDYALHLDSIGDKESALEYQLMNCHLVEKHLDYFFDHGMTFPIYFSNREMVSIIYRDLGLHSDAIRTYLSVINDMKEVAPELIPFYTNFIAPSLGQCKDPELCDSVYSLSLALDIIKANPPQKQSVKDFVQLSKYFNYNRFYNDKMEECDAWFDKYAGYINNLDSTIYRDEILDFYLDYADIVYMRASNASARENDNFKAISLLEKAIATLEHVVTYNTQVQLMIASYNSEIGRNYFSLNNKIKSKEFSEKAAFFLLNNYFGIKNLEYCNLLSNLALNFWSLNQPEVAFSLKNAEIEVRKSTLMEPSVSDYGVLMMYNSVVNPIDNIRIGESVIEHFGDTCNMTEIYGFMADAYSFLMKEQKSSSEKFEYYKSMSKEYIDKAYHMFEQNISYYKQHGLYEQKLSGLYSREAWHYIRLGVMDSAYNYFTKAYDIDRREDRLFDVCMLAAITNNIFALHDYLPTYYNYIESDLKTMLPMLGSVESESYLQQGFHPLYQIIEWSTYNPQDSVCASLAYNSILLSKNLYMSSSTLMPYLPDNDSLRGDYTSLLASKDSIFCDFSNQSRASALLNYELRERELRSSIIDKITPKLFVRWSDVQKSLGQDEVAIEFIEYTKHNWPENNDIKERRYAALVIDKSRSYPISIDLFSLNEIDEVYENQPSSYTNNLGYELYEKLWTRLLPFIDSASKVYFSPMGLLGMINIESLMDSEGIPAYERFPLIRLSSTKQIKFNKQRSLESVILFGGIDYSTKELKNNSFTLDSLNTRGNWSYLSETLNEVNDIEKLVNDENKNLSLYKYVGINATESQFKLSCKEHPSIIHIASHGFYVPEGKRNSIPYYKIEDTYSLTDNQFYCGLVFAGGQDSWNNSLFQIEADDGILSSYEISKLDFRSADLIVLSACETGIGDLSYDGILGLQRGFKSAGANSIIMSLWKIDDAATALFMTSFYQTYLKTRSKQEAMMIARRIVKNTYPDPYYWAAFILLD